MAAEERLPAEGREGDQAFVYVISAGDAVQKIGLTRSSPWRRLASLQTAHHVRLSLVGFAPVEKHQAKRIEQTAHAILKDRRGSGEWFNVSCSLAVAAVEQAAGVSCERPAEVAAGPILLAGQLRAARAMLKWTVAEVAERAGVAPNTITRVEADKSVNTATLRTMQAGYEAARDD